MGYDSATCTALRVDAYIAVKGAKAAIEFYEEVFGAEQLMCLTGPNGLVGHAEIKIGNSVIMLADEHPDFGAWSPVSIGGSPVKFTLEVTGVDKFFARAIEKGCTELRSLEDQFYGYRGGMVSDPFGYSWFIQEKIEEVSEAEMQSRWDRVFEG